LFHWLAWMAAVAGMIFIVISKQHYTVDVVVAYYVTTRLFWIYHTMANNMELKVHTKISTAKIYLKNKNYFWFKICKKYIWIRT